MQPPSENTGGTRDDGTRDELRSDVKQVASSATNKIHSELDHRKGDAATQVKSLSSALERAGGELDQGAPAWLKSSFEKGARQIQQFAETLEQKDSRQITEDVRNFARKSPGTFLAGCAAAGFAAARIFKAGETSASQGSGSASFEGQDRAFGNAGNASAPPASRELT